MHGSIFVADLAVVLCVAAVTTVVARRLRQSTVLGYLTAGLIVGPYLPIPIFADATRVQALADFGVVLVMFAVGMEFRIAKLRRVLPVSGLTGVVQIGFLAWCGFTTANLLGWNTIESVFLGGCLAISSTMLVSKVLDQVPVARGVREHVFGVLVIQDLTAIVLLAAMSAVAAGGNLAPRELAATLVRLGGVLVALLGGGLLVVPRLVRAVARTKSREVLVVVAIGLSFGLARLADALGYSIALGAFLAGILVAESGRVRVVEPLIAPLRDVFAAVFFVSVGMSVDPVVAFRHLPTSLLVSCIVIGGQLVSVTVAGCLSGLGLFRSVAAGLALGQIGEFAFIIAAIGMSAGVVPPELQPIIVSVAVITAFTTSLLLRATQPIVHAIDRRLPPRVVQLLTLYEAWVERYRASAGGPGSATPERRAVRALALDGLGLLLLLAATVTWLPRGTVWLSGRFGLTLTAGRTLLASAAFLLGAPILVGIGRNTLALANRLGASVLARHAEPTPAARLAANTARVLVLFVVLLAVGMPTLAVLRPLMGAAYGMPLFLLALLAIALYLWRNAGAIAAEYRSGAEELAEILARQSAGEEPPESESAALLPGLESSRPFTVASGPAVGRTLAELDLRARTGATVVTIQRRGTRLLLPTGHERLEPGDVLALVGSEEALARALAVLAADVDADAPLPA